MIQCARVMLPMVNDLGALRFQAGHALAPGWFRGFFDLDDVADTFLDVRVLGKGVLWVNGHALGRFWNIGPQQTLYAPAPWLKRGRNEVIAFDMLERSDRRSHGRTEPLFTTVLS